MGAESVQEPASATQKSSASGSANASSTSMLNKVYELKAHQAISKLKSIIRANGDDPYTMQSEVSKLKSEYLKSQFGQEIRFNSE